MTGLLILFLATVFLAYSNGANDNFKGVATLFGSGTTNYRPAIWWATIITFIGSVLSIFLANTLVKNFSGKGLVPDIIAGSPDFLMAVALGAGLTVMLATVTGFPISTTHSLTGALFGTGLAAAGSQVNTSILGKSFFLPLLVSPFIALALAAGLYVILRSARLKFGVTKEWCICAGEAERVEPIPQPATALAFSKSPAINLSMNTEEHCSERYSGKLMGINIQKALDLAHYFSAGIVSFARGLNDTPKIVALLVAVKAFGIQTGMLAVAAGMAVGGLLNARKVAETMSKKITPMNHGQGFTANIITGILVVFASRMGVPVSTTHVSVGSLFGIGLITRKANVRIVSEILMSWLLTLPVAAALGGLVYMCL
jgi:inorganic phosphate transporter, PiT family